MHLYEGDRCPGTEVTDDCELQPGSWELNLGPLENTQCTKLRSHLCSPASKDSSSEPSMRAAEIESAEGYPERGNGTQTL